MKYRILQKNDGRFVIETKAIVTKGILWWKKKEKLWTPCDVDGVPLTNDEDKKLYTKHYYSKKNATKQHKIWNKKNRIFKL